MRTLSATLRRPRPRAIADRAAPHIGPRKSGLIAARIRLFTAHLLRRHIARGSQRLAPQPALSAGEQPGTARNPPSARAHLRPVRPHPVGCRGRAGSRGWCPRAGGGAGGWDGNGRGRGRCVATATLAPTGGASAVAPIAAELEIAPAERRYRTKEVPGAGGTARCGSHTIRPLGHGHTLTRVRPAIDSAHTRRTMQWDACSGDLVGAQPCWMARGSRAARLRGLEPAWIDGRGLRGAS